jgi:2-methylcitrate dehydratase PrpD
VSAIRQLVGREQATIIGFGDKTTVTYAALVNGAMGSTQLDDTRLASLGHPAVGLCRPCYPLANGNTKVLKMHRRCGRYELAMAAGAAIEVRL